LELLSLFIAWSSIGSKSKITFYSRTFILTSVGLYPIFQLFVYQFFYIHLRNIEELLES